MSASAILLALDRLFEPGTEIVAAGRVRGRIVKIDHYTADHRPVMDVHIVVGGEQTFVVTTTAAKRGEEPPVPAHLVLAHPPSAADLARALAPRMRAIDSTISAGLYNGGDDSKDRPPEGDDYTFLWDAILDECKAAAPEVDMTAEIAREKGA